MAEYNKGSIHSNEEMDGVVSEVSFIDDPEELDELSSSEEPHVRYAVVTNPHASMETIQKLTFDEDEVISGIAQEILDMDDETVDKIIKLDNKFTEDHDKVERIMSEYKKAYEKDPIGCKEEYEKYSEIVGEIGKVMKDKQTINSMHILRALNMKKKELPDNIVEFKTRDIDEVNDEQEFTEEDESGL